MNGDSEILFKAISRLVDKALSKVSYDREGRILSVEDNGKCSVIIDGNKYSVRNGIGITFNRGDKCLVHYINGNQNNKVIIAKL